MKDVQREHYQEWPWWLQRWRCQQVGHEAFQWDTYTHSLASSPTLWTEVSPLQADLATTPKWTPQLLTTCSSLTQISAPNRTLTSKTTLEYHGHIATAACPNKHSSLKYLHIVRFVLLSRLVLEWLPPKPSSIYLQLSRWRVKTWKKIRVKIWGIPWGWGAPHWRRWKG